MSVSVAATAAPTLSLAEAQRRALDRSQQLVAQDETVTASREMAVAAGQLPDPVARLGIDNLPVNGPDAFSLTRDFMTVRSIGVMQELTRSDKRQARADRYEREAQQALSQKTVTAAEIERDTALTWLDRWYADAMVGAMSDAQREARLETEAAESAYRGGRGSLADVLAARAALAGLDDRASELRRRATTARVALARWIGEGADAPLGERPGIDHIALDASTLGAEIEHHPDIAVLKRKEDVAAAEVRVAEVNRNPDWSVELMYSQRGSAYSNMVSVNVSVPLQWDRRNRQDRELAAKLAMLDQAHAEREEMTRAHVAELRVMVTDWQSGRERLARYRREILPLASERTQALLGGYQGAKNGLGDVLMARRNEIETRLQALQLELDTARLWAQLTFIFPRDARYAAPMAHEEKP